MTRDEGGRARYTLTDEGAFLRLRWAEGVTMGEDDVHSTIAAVTAASPEGRRPLLVNIGLVASITAEARRLLIEDTCSSRTAVVGVDEMGKVLTAFNYRALTPSRYFLDEAEALGWLASAPGMPQEDRADPAEFFDAWLDDDLLVVEWRAGVRVGAFTAELLVDRVRALSEDVRHPLLSLSRSMISFTEEAIVIIAQQLDVTALALVGLAEDPAITAYYQQLRKPQYAVGYFGTAAEARRWLAREPRA